MLSDLALAHAAVPPKDQHPDSVPHPATLLAGRLAAIIIPLLRLISAAVPVLGVFYLPLHARITGAHRRFAALLARLAAGQFPRPHVAKPGTKGGPQAAYIPLRRAWIVVKLGHHAAGYASQLQLLLNDPATLALLAAAPPAAQSSAGQSSAGRILRPLARLLGVDLSAILQAPPKPPGPKPAKPVRPRLPPLLPLYPQRRPRLILFPDPPRPKKPR